MAGSSEKWFVHRGEYLKAENEILRSKLPQRMTDTASEWERPVKLGGAVGSALKHLNTIVSIQMFALGSPLR